METSCRSHHWQRQLATLLVNGSRSFTSRVRLWMITRLEIDWHSRRSTNVVTVSHLSIGCCSCATNVNRRSSLLHLRLRSPNTHCCIRPSASSARYHEHCWLSTQRRYVDVLNASDTRQNVVLNTKFDVRPISQSLNLCKEPHLHRAHRRWTTFKDI
jgi:hypothetical protein